MPRVLRAWGGRKSWDINDTMVCKGEGPQAVPVLLMFQQDIRGGGFRWRKDGGEKNLNEPHPGSYNPPKPGAAG